MTEKEWDEEIEKKILKICCTEFKNIQEVMAVLRGYLAADRKHQREEMLKRLTKNDIEKCIHALRKRRNYFPISLEDEAEAIHKLVKDKLK